MKIIQIFDINKKKICDLKEYKNIKIESFLESGDESLSFYMRRNSEFYNNILEECYVQTGEQEYVIKNKKIINEEYALLECQLNLEDLEAIILSKFDNNRINIDETMNKVLLNTGWSFNVTNSKKIRRILRIDSNVLDVIKNIFEVYNYKPIFNTLSKTISIRISEEKGVYNFDEINIKRIGDNSYDYATRMIPKGINNLDISKINNGKNFVENHVHSNKIKSIYWKNTNYSNPEDLKEDAEIRLSQLAKPRETFIVKVSDLSQISKINILDYRVGDKLTHKNLIKTEILTIIRLINYPDNIYNNLAIISNCTLNFPKPEEKLKEIANLVSNAILDDGTINGKVIDNIDVNQIQDFKNKVSDAAQVNKILSQIDEMNLNKVNVAELNATKAKINDLEVTGTATIRRLNVTDANIENLKTHDLTTINANIKNLKVEKAEVNDLKVINEDVTKLKAEDANIKNAAIENLKATNAEITTLKAEKADITGLNAAVGKIGVLESKTASFENALAGNLTADNFHANSITAGSGIIAEGAIGDAQINSLSGNKLNFGTVDTSKVTIAGSTGRFRIVGNKLQVLDNKDGKLYERIMLGIDDNNKSTLALRGKDGQTTLIDENGLTDAGFTNGYGKIDENSLDASKFDKNSIVRQVNGSTETIKGTKVQIGDRTLDVELSTQNNTITEHGKELSTQKTTIQALDNAIKLKVDNQTFTQFTNTISTDINTTKQDAIKQANKNTIDSINNIKIGGRNFFKKTTPMNQLAGKVTLTRNNNENGFIFEGNQTGENIARISGVITENGYWTFSALVSTNATGSPTMNIDICDKDIENISIPAGGGGADFGSYKKIVKTAYINNYSSNTYNFVDIQYNAWATLKFKNVKIEKGNKPTDWTPAPEDIQDNIDNAINSANAYTTAQITTVNTNLSKATSEVNILKEQISTKVSQSDVDRSISNIEFGGRNLILKSDLLKFNPNNTGLGTSTLQSDNTGKFYRAIPDVGKTVSLYYFCTGDNISEQLVTDSKTLYSMSLDVRVSKDSVVSRFNFENEKWKQVSLSKDQWTRIKLEGFTLPSTTNKALIIALDSSPNVYLDYRNLKIEKGTKCSDWTPAPDDLKAIIDLAKKTDEKINQVSTELKQTKESFGVSVNSLNSKTSTIETNISNTSTLLNGKIDKAKIDAINNAVNQAKSIADSKKNEAINTANQNTNNKINEITIGSRNYFINGDFSEPIISGAGTIVDVTGEGSKKVPFKKCLYLSNKQGISGYDLIPGLNINPNAFNGKKIAISFWAKYRNVTLGVNDWNRLRFGELDVFGTDSYAWYPGILSVVGTNETWTKYRGFIDLSNCDGKTITGLNAKFLLEGTSAGEAWVTGIQYEIGSKITDWKPAVEDTRSNIESAKGEAINSSNSYTNSAKQQAIDSANSHANSIAEQKKNEAIWGSRNIPDTRNDNQSPGWYFKTYPNQSITEFKYSNSIGITASGNPYGTLETKVPWGDASGGYPVQTFRSNSTATYQRHGTSNTTWSGWIQIEDTQGSQSKANTAKNEANGYTNTQINTVNSKVSNVQSNLNVLKNEINTKVSKSDIDKTVTNINNQIKLSNEKINTAESSFTQKTNSINSKVSQIESTTNTLNGKITSNTNRISNAESKITPNAIVNSVNSNIASGGAIKGTSTILDKDKLTIKDSDNSRIELQKGGIFAYNTTNKKTYYLNDGEIGICAKDNSDALGILTSVYRQDGDFVNKTYPYGNMKGVGLFAGDYAQYIALGHDLIWGDDSKYQSYIICNKNGWIHLGTGLNFNSKESIYNLVGLNKKQSSELFISELSISNNQVNTNSSDGNLWLNYGKGYDCWKSGQDNINVRIGRGWNNGQHGGLVCQDLWVHGNKHRIVDCGDLGFIGMEAYETSSPYFGDIGNAKLDENGVCYIVFDREFMEVTDTNVNYKVDISIVSENLDVKVQVAKKFIDKVKIIGTPGTEFDFEIKAIQKGVEQKRFKRIDEKRNEKVNYSINDEVLGKQPSKNIAKGEGVMDDMELLRSTRYKEIMNNKTTNKAYEILNYMEGVMNNG
ncbi:prophage endopeptidase tail family protein [Clostridium sardiniense]|uniref:prophage endopeptidase tail family protein n=1 Tax=Clostridium sardiniense TaxID=29369 RepID=UPI00195E8282|nr:hypothetical protein [Clostridium sardiniense]MBM7835704.1 chaperonin cofactor prefoldin [Clostridium sardiniense]